MKYTDKRAIFSVCVLHNLTSPDKLLKEKEISSWLKRRQVCNVNRFTRLLRKYCVVISKKSDHTDISKSTDQQSAKAFGETEMKGRTSFIF